MSDTSCRVIIWDCPPDEAPALLQYLLGSLDMVTDGPHGRATAPTGPPGVVWTATPTPDDELLLGGTGYGYDDGCQPGMVNDGALTANLMELAPGASWLAWEDPYEEHLGTVHMFTPELGLFTGDCDSTGSVAVTSSKEVRAASAEGRMYELLGLPWTDRFEELESKLGPGAWIPAAPPAEPDEVLVPRVALLQWRDAVDTIIGLLDPLTGSPLKAVSDAIAAVGVDG